MRYRIAVWHEMVVTQEYLEGKIRIYAILSESFFELFHLKITELKRCRYNKARIQAGFIVISPSRDSWRCRGAGRTSGGTVFLFANPPQQETHHAEPWKSPCLAGPERNPHHLHDMGSADWTGALPSGSHFRRDGAWRRKILVPRQASSVKRQAHGGGKGIPFLPFLFNKAGLLSPEQPRITFGDRGFPRTQSSSLNSCIYSGTQAFQPRPSCKCIRMASAEQGSP